MYHNSAYPPTELSPVHQSSQTLRSRVGGGKLHTDRVETNRNRASPSGLLVLSNSAQVQNSTYCMQHSSSWEANRFTASQEIPRILWNPKVHYRSQKLK